MDIQTVLMVDDDPAIRRIANLSLTRVGHWQVVLAESGAEAIELASQVKPDLILLDVMMPQMDGPTTLGHLRKSSATSETPIIFMTAKVLREEVDAYSKIGAAGVIKKPFDPMTLPASIREVLQK